MTLFAPLTDRAPLCNDNLSANDALRLEDVVIPHLRPFHHKGYTTHGRGQTVTAAKTRIRRFRIINLSYMSCEQRTGTQVTRSTRFELFRFVFQDAMTS